MDLLAMVATVERRTPAVPTGTVHRTVTQSVGRLQIPAPPDLAELLVGPAPLNLAEVVVGPAPPDLVKVVVGPAPLDLVEVLVGPAPQELAEGIKSKIMAAREEVLAWAGLPRMGQT